MSFKIQPLYYSYNLEKKKFWQQSELTSGSNIIFLITGRWIILSSQSLSLFGPQCLCMQVILSLIQSDSRLSALCRGTETPMCVGKEKGLLGVYSDRLKWCFNIPGALSDLWQGSNWGRPREGSPNSGCLAGVGWACARLPRGWWCDFNTAQDTSKDNPRFLSLIWKAIHMGTKRHVALCSISQSPKAADPQPRRESVRSH